VQEERAAQVHRRLDPLIEDADLRAVADADYVALHDDLVARAQLQDLLWIGDRERHFVYCHVTPPGRTRSCRRRRCARSPGAPPSTGS
jgi:hypothetical protein